jgi:16S rRNA (cytidine1402-2'-O)-methyltransferase
MTGTLYVVATPLGNLGDLAPRAAEVLRQVAVVAAEDTRRTRGLLSHLAASPTLLSFHAHSGERRVDTLLEILGDGRDVALVTDAGTPGVSEAGFTVVPIPGPSAVATALSAAGLPADRYLFVGFLPRKGAERTRLLARAAAEEWSVVLFEAPPRLASLLRDLAAAAGPDRRATVARELTKLHEELRAGTLAELADYYSETPPKGELTIVMEGTRTPAAPPDRTAEAVDEATALLAEGLSRREVARRLTETLGMPRNDAYRLVMGLP